MTGFIHKLVASLVKGVVLFVKKTFIDLFTAIRLIFYLIANLSISSLNSYCILVTFKALFISGVACQLVIITTLFDVIKHLLKI